ncbi:MAG: endolytic transglycosylase MltG [Deltaproteobacteria bacterium]|nr:endolytic transglycosylase MltG [Deltaproteobacteria bacterium]
MKRFLFHLLAWVWVAAVVGGVLWARQLDYMATPLDPAAPTKVVDIPAGATLTWISRLLGEEGFIHSPALFKLGARLAGRDRDIKTGEHYLSAAHSPQRILRELTSGPPVLHKVTFPEGVTLKEAARIVDEAGLAGRDRFLALVTDPDVAASLGLPGPTVEGYLFPDTYHLPRKVGAWVIIRTMVKRFNQVYRKIEAASTPPTGQTRRQTVILASLIEAEVQTPKEAPLVAAVFLNRLKQDMRLQCDPTTVYPLDDFEGPITKKHLAADHPYNTYVHSGLPAGPIGNPGANALRAALNPAEVNYLYFVSRNDGTHEFSDNYSQHQKAVRRFQRQ